MLPSEEDKNEEGREPAPAGESREIIERWPRDFPDFIFGHSADGCTFGPADEDGNLAVLPESHTREVWHEALGQMGLPSGKDSHSADGTPFAPTWRSGGAMKDFRILCLAAGILALTAGACNDNSDTTTANLSVVRLTVDAPVTAKSGTSFGVQVRALNAGVAGVHDGHLTVTLPLPLTVISVAASPGTSATFANGASGGSVDWTLGTLDSNSQSKLDITTMGQLAPTEATKKLTVLATMTAQEIKPGDAVAQDDVTLTQ